MSTQDSKFDLWWDSPEVKRVVGAAYSLGAAVVIIGAMFKILHLPGAAQMLGVGMSVEAVLFSLGILDKPHKEFQWDKIYDFDGTGEKQTITATGSNSKSVAETSSVRSVGLNYSETINDDDVKKLSEGIKNLTATADQFASLSNVISSTDKFVKNIDSASLATGVFVKSQETLNQASGMLTTNYQGINDKMDAVEKSTKQYAIKVDDINKNLSSINTIYEIQMKNIQAQSEGLTQQTEQVRLLSKELSQILGDTEKMKGATLMAAEAADAYKNNSIKLAKQIADLNHVYGNMLNALN